MLTRKASSKTNAPPSKLRKLDGSKNSTLQNKINIKNSDKSIKSDTSNVNVFVRIRPENEKEKSENYRTVVKILDEKLLIFDPEEESEPFFFHGTRQNCRDIAKKQNKKLKFLFDGLFGHTVSNWEVHCKTTHSIISSLMDGYNCSVFVYGATGAGKTYTMLGNKNMSPGIMYHTMAELYNKINAISEEKQCQVGVSFVEVYNENVYDLLHPNGPLFIREDASGGVTIVNLKIENILNADQLLEKLSEGNQNRTQHPTDSNAESSRSHAVFQVYLKMTNLDDGQIKISKLSMIDLAGSEKGMATGCKGVRFKEGSNINKSLLALGNCISSLADNLRHIPYRDSKLTRLLKDSLGGNCRTVMIANVSPSSASYEDTYNTLKFASKAKKITNKLEKNILCGDTPRNLYFQQLIEKLETENTLLQSKVRALETITSDSVRAVSQKPDLSVWEIPLEELFEERNLLCESLLKIKSEATILKWRIKYKNSIREMVSMSESVPVSEKAVNKIDASIRQLNGRLAPLDNSIKNIKDQLLLNKEKFDKLFAEMSEAGVLQFIKKDIEHKNDLLGKTMLKISNDFYKRLNKLQEQRIMTHEKAHEVREPIFNYYHKLLYGLQMITIEMAQKHENAVNALQHRREVLWYDTDEKGHNFNQPAIMDLSIDDSLFIIESQYNGSKLKQKIVFPSLESGDNDLVNDCSNKQSIVKNKENYIDDEISKNVYPDNKIGYGGNSTSLVFKNVINDDNQIIDEALNNTITLEATREDGKSPESNEKTVSKPNVKETVLVEIYKPDNNNGIDVENNEENDSANSTITLDTPSLPLSIIDPSSKEKENKCLPLVTKSNQLKSSLKAYKPVISSNLSSRNVLFSAKKRNELKCLTNIKTDENNQITNIKDLPKRQMGKLLPTVKIQPSILMNRVALKYVNNPNTLQNTKDSQDIKSLKMTNQKTRFKLHPYKRPENTTKVSSIR